jgi:hypothetical protein
VPLRRAYQIPLVDPGFSVAEFTRPLSASEQQTLDLYAEAEHVRRRELERWPKAPSTAESTAERRRWAQRWWKAQQPALPLLIEAHRRAPVPLTLLQEQDPSRGRSEPLNVAVGFVSLLTRQAQALEEAQDLDGAWQHYEVALELLRRFRLRASEIDIRYADQLEAGVLSQVAQWAAHTGQTRERIQIVLAKLEDAEQRGLAGDSARKHVYVAVRSVLRGEHARGDHADPYDDVLRDAVRVWRWLP